MIDPNELNALADGELSPERRQELEALIGGSDEARKQFESIVAIKRCLHATASNEACDALWKRCQTRLDEIDRTKRIEGFVGRYAWGICGVFFAAIAIGGFFNRSTERTVASHQVAGYLADVSPIPFPASRNQKDLDPFVRAVMGDAYHSRPAEVRITAAGRDDTPGNRVTFVRLEDGFGPIAVLALHDVRHVSGLYPFDQDSRYKYGRINGASALFWNRADGVICMAVGNRSYSEIRDMLANCEK